MTILRTLMVSALLVGCGAEETTVPTTAPPKPTAAPPAGPPGGPPGAPPAKSGGSAYAVVAVSDGGTIKGTVSYAGSETDGTVSPTKDLEVCENTGGSRPAGTLLVADGKLANAVVFLADVSKGKAWTQDKALVDNVGCRFEPHVSLGRVGGKVAAKNSDPVLHNTNLTLKKKNKKIANIALPKQGQVLEKPLKKPGLVDVRCDAHEWMQGFVYVLANPYGAITGADGGFVIEEVPAGEYTAKVWHERLGEKEAKVTVAAGGEASLAFNYE